MTKYKSVIEVLNAGEIIELFPYTLNKECVFITTDNGEMNYLCDPIFITNGIKDYDTEETKCEIAMMVHGNWVLKTFSYKMMTKNGILDLFQNGFTFEDGKRTAIANYLVKQEKLASFVTRYKGVGFLRNESKDQPVFGLSEPIGNEESDELAWDEEGHHFDVRPKGSFNKWIQMVKDEVLCSINLQYILAISCSALLLAYLNRVEKEDIGTQITHLMGLSTTGKSTATMLGVSVNGIPQKTQTSLYQSFNGTENAVIKKLNGNIGVCYGLDEFSMSKIEDMTAMVYRIAEGFEKDRLNETSTLQNRAEWITSIIANGETSILAKTTYNIGIQVRLQQFENEQWTHDAAHSERIKRTIQENYGHAGIIFARYVANDWSMIRKVVDKWDNYFKDNLVKSPTKDRMARKYGVTVAALELAGKAWDVSFDLQGVASFIQQHEKTFAMQRDVAEAVLTEIIEDVQTHEALFEGNREASGNLLEQKGKITRVGDEYVVHYLVDAFDQLLVSLAYSDKQTVINALKKKNYLQSEKGRSTKRTIVAGERKPTYEIHIPANRFNS